MTGTYSVAEYKEFDEKEFHKMGLKYLGRIKVERLRLAMAAQARMGKIKMWAIWLSTLLLLWACMLQLAALGHTFGPRFVGHWYPSAPNFPPKRIYKTNGYLLVSSNGGLNQMRAGICDMVTVARYMNVTLIIPGLDRTSFWNDTSDFKDVFDVDYFITSLRDEVEILKELPPHLKTIQEMGTYYSMPPVSWSNMTYYYHKILPQIQEYELLHLTHTDARLANNGLPEEVQKLRCRVNYENLRFATPLEKLGKKMVDALRKKGPYLVLHLRYEMDMIAFSGCTEGCTDEEIEELTTMRYAISWWKEKKINSKKKRLEGLCPMTPEEITLTLLALDIDRNIQIYIAAGDIYGGERRLAFLRKAFPNLINKKEMLVPASDLEPFIKHSTQMAAVDYLISIESDIFVPTYEGNMAKVVEGHRRYMGFQKTIVPHKMLLIKLMDKYKRKKISWKKFARIVKKAHAKRMGQPTKRLVIPGKPKKEDYFWSNPQECLPTFKKEEPPTMSLPVP